jgi:hypothetical protein
VLGRGRIERDVRRLILVNALIFAVLAAAAALAYYGYSATNEQTSRERELMQDLAEEKVLNVEYLVTQADIKLMGEVNLDEMGEPLQKLPATTGAAIVSVYVLDHDKKLVPGGFVSTRASREEGIAFRDWFLERVLPSLPLDQEKVGKRGHLYLNLEGRPYLFSFMKRVSKGRTFYVVIENDLVHVFVRLFPQFFTDLLNKRLYQVVDENGQLRYGDSFGEVEDGFVVEQPFLDTLDG